MKNIAFICVHNSCRSQMAEAFARRMAGGRYAFYSAGTQVVPAINADAVRLMRARYGIDMSGQYSKLIDAIPAPDIAISMGCGVRCPFIGRGFDEDWSLTDPTGQGDAVFCEVIAQIEARVRELIARLDAQDD